MSKMGQNNTYTY